MGALKIMADGGEIQVVALKSITVRPELTQVRAEVDGDWIKIIADGYVRGADIPAILCARIVVGEERRPDPDWEGMLLLIDGHHRYAAAKDRAKLKTIRAQIKDFTLEEALLAALEANTAKYHMGRKFEDADRRRTVEMMIRNEEMRTWPDTRIAKITGASIVTVRTVRVRLSETGGVPLPDKVRVFHGDHPSDTWRRYRNDPSSPAVYDRSRGGGAGCFTARVDGKMTRLPQDKESAEATASSLMERRSWARKMLNNGGAFRGYLAVRHIITDGLHPTEFPMGGLRLGDTYIIPAAEPGLWPKALAACLLAIKALPWAKRFIICTQVNSNGILFHCRALAALPPYPVEFLTPEELVAEFAPKADDPATPPPPSPPPA
jgi:hypothetical protein